MKTTAFLLAVSAFLFAGCRFKAPLVTEDTLPIDPAVIGLWEHVPEDGKKPEAEKRMLVLKFSETEYTVRQPIGDGVIHYRAYPIELAGVRCVQLEAIGDGKGPLGGDDGITTPFQVVSYQAKDGTLVVSTLNDELFTDKLQTTEALQEAFLKHKDGEVLFGEATSYRRVKSD